MQMSKAFATKTPGHQESPSSLCFFVPWWLCGYFLDKLI
jgi:hypothetical protein